jgi:hypothetical protein
LARAVAAAWSCRRLALTVPKTTPVRLTMPTCWRAHRSVPRQDLAAGGGSRGLVGLAVPFHDQEPPQRHNRDLSVRHRRPPSPRPESFASELGPAGSARRRGQRPSPPPVHRSLGVAATWKASCRLKRSAVGRVAGPVHRQQLPVAFDALERPRSVVVQGCARPSRQRRRRVARPRRRAARRESERRCREAGLEGRSRSGDHQASIAASARCSAAVAPGGRNRPAGISQTTGETVYRRSGSAPCSPPWDRRRAGP